MNYARYRSELERQGFVFERDRLVRLPPPVDHLSIVPLGYIEHERYLYLLISARDEILAQRGRPVRVWSRARTNEEEFEPMTSKQDDTDRELEQPAEPKDPQRIKRGLLSDEPERIAEERRQKGALLLLLEEMEAEEVQREHLRALGGEPEENEEKPAGGPIEGTATTYNDLGRKQDL